ncbi:unnamed protein product, partial [Ectocarpus sp. 6 AP-2014]
EAVRILRLDRLTGLDQGENETEGCNANENGIREPEQSRGAGNRGENGATPTGTECENESEFRERISRTRSESGVLRDNAGKRSDTRATLKGEKGGRRTKLGPSKSPNM